MGSSFIHLIRIDSNEFAPRLLYGTTLTSIHDDWKNHSFHYMDLCRQVMSLLYNMLSSFVIAFLPRIKCLLNSWLQSPSTVILEPKNIKYATFPIFSSSISHEVIGPDAIILVFWMLKFKPAFSLSSFTFIKRLFSSSLLFAIRVYHLHVRLLFLLAILIPACASSSLAFHMMYSA